MTAKKPKPDSFLPNFCDVRTLFIVIMLSELLAIVLALKHLTINQQGLVDLAVYSLFIQWIALFCLAGLCLARNYLNQLADFWVACLSYSLILIISLFVTEISWQVFHIKLALPYLSNTSHSSFLIQCLGISAIFGALTLRYFYVKHQWRKNIESEANAKLQALQARIRPHFLFNCMNTIASLVRKDPILAEEITENISDLFRAYLHEIDRLSTIAEEILLCERYLHVEYQRLGNRLKVVWEVDGLPDKLPLPSLTLQPLIENAIYHGIEKLPQGGEIRIKSKITNNKILISITNPLPSKTYSQNQGNKMAQENIRQRLAIHYGHQELLLTEYNEHYYTTKLIIPYSHEDIDS